MTTAVLPATGFSDLSWASPSRSASPRRVGTMVRSSPSADPVAQALGELAEVEAECATPGWDGYNATPIRRRAVLEAGHLLKSLPRWIAIPEVLPEPDGGIGLEWSNSRDERFAVILDGDMTLVFAGKFADGSKRRGVARFLQAPPDDVVAILETHFRASQG